MARPMLTISFTCVFSGGYKDFYTIVDAQGEDHKIEYEQYEGYGCSYYVRYNNRIMASSGWVNLFDSFSMYACV